MTSGETGEPDEHSAPDPHDDTGTQTPAVPEWSEEKFQQAFIAQSLKRARISYAFTLMLIAWVTFIGARRGIDANAEFVTRLRLGVIFPTICVLLAASYVPQLRRHYTIITSIGITIGGLAVILAGVVASINGVSYVKVTSVLVLVHATLILGLRTKVSATVAVALVLGYVAIAVWYGVLVNEIEFVTSVLAVTAALCVLTTSSLEDARRSSMREENRLAEEARRDGLTGLYNRREFDSLTEQLWQQAFREQQFLQIVLIDIDRFKYFNDLYGHQAGDECLRRISRIIARAARRPLDFCARFGGEEFALVFYGDVPQRPLTQTIEELREAVMEEAIPHAHSEVAKVVTISIGSAVGSPHSGRSLARLIQRADEALYRAKQSGRNRAVHRDLDPADSDTGSFQAGRIRRAAG